MRALRVGVVLGACVAAASGCGTFANSFAPRQYPHLYGGVEFDYLALKGVWSPAKSDQPEATGFVDRFLDSLGGRLFCTTFIVIDFPLSFVGDTITLPYVLLGPGLQGWYPGWEWAPAEPPSHLSPPGPPR
jgi:uncharacterized protein YceK